SPARRAALFGAGATARGAQSCARRAMACVCRSGLDSARAAPDPLPGAPTLSDAQTMVDVTRIEPYLEQALGDIEIPGLPEPSRGKVRDNYDLPDGRRIIVASDRLSAFDQVLTTIPLKGQALTQIARFWFDATADLCPNHVEAYPDPNVAVCQRLTIMP